jgi:GntR family transcriptional regulator
MERYAISASTANKVITLLKSTGLVESKVGRGVFVRKRTQLVRHVHDRYARHHRDAGKAPFRSEVEAQGRTPRVDVVGIDPVVPPQWIAERLGIAPDVEVLCRQNIYYVDDQPIQTVNTYIPLDIAANTPLEAPVPGPGGIYATFEDLGHRLTRMLEEVTSRMARSDEARKLDLDPATPILDVVHVSYDQDERPMDVSHFLLRGDANLLAYELPTD